MTNDTVFGTQGGDDQSTTKTATPLEDTLHIGEGKQYASIEEADKALAFKEDHIKTLEQENETLRKQMEEARKIDDVLKSIENQNLAQGSTGATTSGNHQTLDIDAVTQAVTQSLTAKQEAERRSNNIKSLEAKLSEKFGEKAKDAFLAKQEELGVNLSDLAAQNPDAAFKFFESGKQPASTYGSSVNTQAVANINGGPEFGTHEYWNKLHKEGKISLDKKIQEQHKSLAALGPDKYYGK